MKYFKYKLSVLLFLDSLKLVISIVLYFNIRIEKDLIKKIIEKLSSASFGAYLLLCIFDSIFYEFLKINVPNINSRFVYAPLIILLVYICSLLLSLVVNYVQSLVMGISKKIYNN